MISFAIGAALGAAIINIVCAAMADYRGDRARRRAHLTWTWGFIALAWVLIFARGIA